MIYLTRGRLLEAAVFSLEMGPLHNPVTWYKITHIGTQVTQWDFQNKATRTSLPWPIFVSQVLLYNLRPSMCDFVSCDRIVQRAYSTVIIRRDAFRGLKRMGRLAFFPTRPRPHRLFPQRKIRLPAAYLIGDWTILLLFSMTDTRLCWKEKDAFPKTFKKVLACYNLRCPKL